MTLEERILNFIEEGCDKPSWEGKELRAIALEVRKREDRIKQLEDRIKRLEEAYAAKDQQLSNLLHICRDNDIEVSSYDLIHGRKAK